MQLGWTDYAYLTIMVIIANWAAWRCYQIFGYYPNFRSRWKRLAIVGPLPLLTFAMMAGLWYLNTH